MTLSEALDVLGVEAHDDEKTVRKAYAKQAKIYRPDTHLVEFSRVRDAYEVAMEALQTSKTLPASDISDASDASDASDTLDAFNAEGPDNSELKINDSITQHSRVISYVVKSLNADNVEHSAPLINPLQAMEDDIVQAIKETKPGHTELENKVVRLFDDYLRRASRHSVALRDHAERFLIGTCLGDYYVPRKLWVRAADLTGLGTAVVVEDNLQRWERELLLRFDEAEVVHDLLTRANQGDNLVEKAVVHNVSWSKVLMLRMDEAQASLVNQWMGWLDGTFGSDAGYVSDEFRKRWHRLQQIEPLNAITIAVFAGVMVLSGLGLSKLDVPLGQFFKLPRSSMALMVIGLTVLSWANFLLVMLARPVVRKFSSSSRRWLHTHAATPLLVIECLAALGVIWISALWGVGVNDIGANEGGASSLSSMLVSVFGVTLLAVGALSRDWRWLGAVPFSKMVLLIFWYYFLLILAHALLGSSAGAHSVWVVVALVVMALPPRALFQRLERVKTESGAGSVKSATKNKNSGNKSGRVKRFVSLRTSRQEHSIVAVRLLIGLGACGCVVAIALVHGWFLEAQSWVQPVVTGALCSLLALELALNGGLHSEGPSGGKSRPLVFEVAGLVGVLGWWLSAVVDEILVIQLCLAVFLMWSAAWYVAARRGASVSGPID